MKTLKEQATNVAKCIKEIRGVVGITTTQPDAECHRLTPELYEIVVNFAKKYHLNPDYIVKIMCFRKETTRSRYYKRDKIN